jgi:hypothetical protein
MKVKLSLALAKKTILEVEIQTYDTNYFHLMKLMN